MKKGLVNRRSFLSTLGTAVAAAGCGPYVRSSRRADRPNLLFIWTDQQRADTLAQTGGPHLQVPALNRLATQSVVFRNAYVTQPVCTPSRSSVLTGLWPHQNGCIRNNVPLRKETECLPELLGDSSYRTGYFGKWHLGDEVFAQHGFEEWVSTEDGYGKFYSEGRDRATRSTYHHFLEAREVLGQGDPNNRGLNGKLAAELCKPAFLADRACDFLRRHQRDPFILHVNYLQPHNPYTGPFNTMYDPALVRLPPSFSDELGDEEPRRYIKKRRALLNRKVEGCDLGTDLGWRQIAARYYGLLTQVDNSVGTILTELDRLGLSDTTIVVFTSDHGDMLGAHRMLGKTVMYQEAVQIPLLLRLPGALRRHELIDSPVSQIDLVPTLLNLLGSEGREPLPGKSLLSDHNVDASRDVFIEWHDDGKEKGEGDVAESGGLSGSGGPAFRAVVTRGGWKLSISDSDKGQLFNLRDDPFERANLFSSAAHGDTVRDLTARIVKWQKETADDCALKTA